MKISEYIMEGKARLAAASLECANPLLHMKQLLQYAMAWTPSELYQRWDEPLPIGDQERLETFMERRLAGEPFQYIVGEEGFWKSSFAVGPGVLIPRRETELIVETLLERVPQAPSKVAELGAGSGNIGISLVLERPNWDWHAYELNPDTLPYLEKNLRTLLSPSASYFLHAGDFFALAPQESPFDMIVSNPPYVAAADWSTLSREVRSEPRMALDGGPKGLDILSQLLTSSVSLLNQNGIFITEIGSDQEAAARDLATATGFHDVEILKDYSKLPRVVFARRN